MNRRNFLKTTSGAIASLPFVPSLLGEDKLSDELQDLYSFLESKQLNGKPFKLYPFQKQILKNIHENNRLVIVKARQIGMTTLLGGYNSWFENKNKCVIIYKPLYNENFIYYDRIYRSFSDKLEVGPVKGLFYDEYNWRGKFYDEMEDNDNFVTGGKIVIVGTPDPEGRLKKFVDTHTDYVVAHYPAYKCKPKWNYRKMSDYYDTQCSHSGWPEYVRGNIYEREILANLVV